LIATSTKQWIIGSDLLLGHSTIVNLRAPWPKELLICAINIFC